MIVDVLIVAAVAGLLLMAMRIAYEQGVDSGWRQAGRWAEENPSEFLAHLRDHVK